MYIRNYNNNNSNKLCNNLYTYIILNINPKMNLSIKTPLTEHIREQTACISDL